MIENAYELFVSNSGSVEFDKNTQFLFTEGEIGRYNVHRKVTLGEYPALKGAAIIHQIESDKKI